MILMMKIVHQFQSKKEIFNKLAEERLKKITELDKKIIGNDLIYKYKSKKNPNEKFDEYDNALYLIVKVKILK